MKKKSSLFSLLFFLLSFAQAQSVAVVEKVRASVADGMVEITYDLTKAQPGETFTVWVKVFSPDGKEIPARTFSGDVGEGISAGSGRRINWNAAQDIPGVSATLRFEVFAKSENTKVSFFQSPRGKTLWKSLVLPGWGQSANHGKPFWLAGVASYGLLGASVLLNRQAGSDYDKYLAATEQPARSDYFSQAEDRDRLSKTLGLTAAVIWAGNLVWAAVDRPAGPALSLQPSAEGIGLSVRF